MGYKGGISKDIPDEYHWWDIDWIIFGCKPILVLKYPICLIKWELYAIIMKSIGEIEEKLATKTEPILGFKPSSKIKRGPIGILISIICIAIVFRELSRSGVI